MGREHPPLLCPLGQRSHADVWLEVVKPHPRELGPNGPQLVQIQAIKKVLIVHHVLLSSACAS